MPERCVGDQSDLVQAGISGEACVVAVHHGCRQADLPHSRENLTDKRSCQQVLAATNQSDNFQAVTRQQHALWVLGAGDEFPVAFDGQIP